MQKMFFLLLAFSSLYSQCCSPIGTCAPTNCAFLPSASPCTYWDFSLEFLYWEATERGLEYALTNTVHQPSFSFQPAFRIGLGTHLPYDDWDLAFTYTHYETHTHNHRTGTIRSVWTSATAFEGDIFLAFWQDARARWKLHSHFFDLQLKNRLFISQAISLEPAFGLKLALLQQRFDVLYHNGNTGFISSQIGMKNRSLNLGPVASLNSRWSLSDHLDLLGNLSASLLTSRFTIGHHESNLGIGGGTLIQANEYWAMRPQLTAAFGLGWAHCFSKDRTVYYYGLQASYEAQVWWKQNMLYRFIDQTSPAMIAPTQGDLFLHGLTLEAYIHF